MPVLHHGGAAEPRPALQGSGTQRMDQRDLDRVSEGEGYYRTERGRYKGQEGLYTDR